MNHNEYQGWYNYETWCVRLWIDRSKEWRLQAQDMAQKAETPYLLAAALKEWLVEDNQPFMGGSMWDDLLNAALSEVNWEEIAEKLYMDAHPTAEAPAANQKVPAGFEVFYMSTEDIHPQARGRFPSPGWYWWECQPGCLPDSEPDGPYKTEAEAISHTLPDDEVDPTGDQIYLDVDMIARGYEWVCPNPNCNHYNNEIEWKSEVECPHCHTKGRTSPPEHALGS